MNMVFQNRLEAASLLLNRLSQYKNKNVVVAGIPRGAIPMASHIAHGLKGELTAVLVRKITAPDNDEFAIGSIGLSGKIHLSPWASSMADSSYLEKAVEGELKLLRGRESRYGLGTPHYKGRTVIIVDDGIATGETTLGAVREVRSWDARKIVLAVPVSSKEATDALRDEVDELIVLSIPPLMSSVGQFYLSFPQVDDREVEKILRESRDNLTQELF
jgi:putative phosphoribosyl transferase